MDGVRRLAGRAAANPAGRPLDVLVEAGYPGGRCGVRTLAEGLAVARTVGDAAPLLRLAGVEGYEGLLQTSPPEGRDEAAAAVVRFVADLARALDGAGLLDDADPVLLSAGGSSFYDLAARILAEPALRPPDPHRRAQRLLPHARRRPLRAAAPPTRRARPARPRRGPRVHARARGLGGGRCPCRSPGWRCSGRGGATSARTPARRRSARHVRDGAERRAPWLAEARIERVSDQHAMVALPDGADVRVGDVVALSPSHPCTTFDKWRAIHVVDEATTVLETVRTYF